MRKLGIKKDLSLEKVFKEYKLIKLKLENLITYENDNHYKNNYEIYKVIFIFILCSELFTEVEYIILLKFKYKNDYCTSECICLLSTMFTLYEGYIDHSEEISQISNLIINDLVWIINELEDEDDNSNGVIDYSGVHVYFVAKI